MSTQEICLFMPPLLITGCVRDWPPKKGEEFELLDAVLISTQMAMTPQGPMPVPHVEELGTLNIRPSGWTAWKHLTAEERKIYTDWRMKKANLTPATSLAGLPPAPGEGPPGPPGPRGPFRIVPPG